MKAYVVINSLRLLRMLAVDFVLRYHVAGIESVFEPDPRRRGHCGSELSISETDGECASG
jgi:hypothetical protein